MLSSRVNCWILRAVFVFLPAAVEACDWVETSDALHIESGSCTLQAIAKSEAIEVAGRVATATETIRVAAGATLVIDGTEFDELRLLSTPDVRANLIAEGATLRIRDIVIKSYDPATNGPDLTVKDGRAFIRVDAFVDANGEAVNGRLEVERSKISYLGYDSRHVHLGTYSSYGISLKVRTEEHLRRATVTGHIVNSTLSHNYRGFYSYGAQDFEIRENRIHNNLDYGVDGHDDTDRFIVVGNAVYSNGGTGIICSRRCDNNLFEDNDVYRNGANGIVLHDISTGGRILHNRVFNNQQDGVVVHDSQNTLVAGNEIRRNRYGIRVFAGSVLTSIKYNRIKLSSVADIFVKNGNLEANDDLSDFSNGKDWNSKNLSRHNSSRVWGTAVFQNSFGSPAKVVVRGAEYLSFSRNNYPAGVTFDIRSSDNVELDGADSGRAVSYVLRANGDEVAHYRIAASSGARLSMSGYDHVILEGDRLLLPDGSHFLLSVDELRPKELTLEVDDKSEIRSGILTTLPIEPVSGAAAFSKYKDVFTVDRSFSLRIVTDPSKRFQMKALDRLCSTVEWSLGEDRFIASGQDVVELSSIGQTDLTIRCLSFARD